MNMYSDVKGKINLAFISEKDEERILYNNSFTHTSKNMDLEFKILSGNGGTFPNETTEKIVHYPIGTKLSDELVEDLVLTDGYSIRNYKLEAFDDTKNKFKAGDKILDSLNGVSLDYPMIININYIEPAVGIGIGDTSNDKGLVYRSYTDNSIKSDPIDLKVFKNGLDITKQIENLTYYDKKDGNVITDFDLSNGATTFTVYVTGTLEGASINREVIVKYGSVALSSEGSILYTVEDAIKQATPGTPIVAKYNASFASKEISEKVYGGMPVIPAGVTLVTASSNEYITEIEKDGTYGTFTKDKPFTELYIPEDIELSINGKLMIHAFTNGDTNFGGTHVTNRGYSQMKLGSNSKIKVNSGGVLESIGFVYGDGEVIGNNGGTIYDLLKLIDFRGGTQTLKFKGEIFPVDQLSISNIEVPITFNPGSSFKGIAQVTVGGAGKVAYANLVGKENSLITFNEGVLKKSTDNNGNMYFEFNSGEFKINDLEVEGLMNTNGKDIPLCGLFKLNVNSGSTLNVDAHIKLLPGSEVNINEGGIVNVTSNGQIFVYDSNMYPEPVNNFSYKAFLSNKKMGTNTFDKYLCHFVNKLFRQNVVIDFDRTNEGRFYVDGTLNTSSGGAFGGKIYRSYDGTVNPSDDAKTQNVSIKQLIFRGIDKNTEFPIITQNMVIVDQ